MGIEGQRIVRATGVFAGATLLSRILGLLRDISISWIFGAGAMTDAFFVAFAIPNFFRRLVGEGSLTVAVVPVYTDYLTGKKGGREEAFRAILGATILVLAILVGVGIWMSPFLVRLQVFGWKNAGTLSLTVNLTRICFPYLFFVSLVALMMGILNAHGHFFAPAVSPCLLNLSLIGGAIVSPLFNPPILALAWGVVLGGVLQLLLQIPFVTRRGLSVYPTFDLGHPAVKEVGKFMLPMAFAASVFQINQIVNRLLASYLPHGSISYLYYADRIFELPIGLFVVALGVAVLPSFSRYASRGDLEGLRAEVTDSLRLSLFLTIPSMVLLIAFGKPIVAVIFQHGAFGPRDSVLTAQALLAYSVGLWAYGGIQVLSRAFYALKDPRTPVKAALVASGVNLTFGMLLMGPLRHSGLALANSLSAVCNFLLLFLWFDRRIGLRKGELVRGVGSTLFCSLPVIPWLLFIKGMGKWLSEGSSFGTVLLLLLGVLGALGIFLGLSFFSGSRELRGLLCGVFGRIPSAPEE